MTDKKMDFRERAELIVRACPIDHVVEGIGSTLAGRTPMAGAGNACATCIAQALLESRNEAIDECAKVAESKIEITEQAPCPDERPGCCIYHIRQVSKFMTWREIATAIRQLKGR